jgi:transcription elongation factor SPT5
VPSIYSAFGRVSYPGSIFIEAPDIEAARKICWGLSNIYSNSNGVRAVPIEDYIVSLRELSSFTPCSPGWVHLKKHPYKGDTAFVADVNPQTLLPSLYVIPRIDTIHRSQKTKRPRRSRPQQALFNADAVRECYGARSVEQRNNAYIFHGNGYRNGFLEVETDDYIPADATPTRDELTFFEKHKEIPVSVLKKAFDMNDALVLQQGDRVLIASGEFQRLSGIVISSDMSSVNVEIPACNMTATLSYDQLRKNILIGDDVRVAAGPNVNALGWVVAVDKNDVIIYKRDHRENAQLGDNENSTHVS